MATSLRDSSNISLPVEVVPMRRKHLQEVLSIEQRVYPTPWSLALFLSELSLSASRAYFVAKSGRRVIGYAGVVMAGSDAHVTTVAVDPQFQGRRVGTMLMLAVVEEAIARGAISLTLEVRSTNVIAQALYKKFGFVSVGLRKNYYIETGEDALIMWARGIDTASYRALLESIKTSLFREGILCTAPVIGSSAPS
ncbi:MAG: ribosomal-protein-alanine N-acetyltransferase [Acidimicrobiia bacterium]